ncbi:PCC domain-containing protein [Brevibacterium picturae]
MTKSARSLKSESTAGDPGYPVGRPGDVVIHAGPRQNPRIVSVPTRHTEHLIDLVEGDGLFDSITGLLDSLEVSGLMVEFVDGEFGGIEYVYPAYGPDAEHPMSFTSDFRFEGPATVHHGSATVGAKDGVPFSHIHASWVTEDGTIRGGHLLPGTLVGPNGMRLRVFALADAQLLSETDPETGFSAFAPAVTVAAAPDHSGDAVVSRVRPGEFIDEAVLAVCREVGFDAAEVRASLGSTTGAVFTAGTAPWPAVEFTRLTGAITGALGDSLQLSLEGEVVDVAGTVHSGVLAARANPVAVTCELFVRRV